MSCASPAPRPDFASFYTLHYLYSSKSHIHITRMSNEPYDPYIPSGSNAGVGPSGQPQGQSNQKISNIQAQIDETVDVMHQNITKVAERGERLDALQDKTDNLAVSAQGFRRGANRVRKQMWWKDMRMRIIIGIGICVLLVVIIVPIVKAVTDKK